MAWFTRGWSFRPGEHAPHAWGRLGGFVDGVYAIAATLLVIAVITLMVTTMLSRRVGPRRA